MTDNRIEIEKAILGSILLKKDLYFDVIGFGIDSSRFTKDSHKKIFDAFGRLICKKITIDYLTLENEAEGVNYDDISELTTSVPSLSKGCIMSYCMLLKEKYIIDCYSNMVLELNDNIGTSTSSQLNDIVIGYMDNINAIGIVQKEEDNGLSESLRIIEEYQIGAIVPPRTGCSDLEMYAPYPPQLVILAARPSMGKTSFMVHLASEFNKSGYKSAIWSLEEESSMIHLRAVSSITGIPMSDMRSKNKLTNIDLSMITKALEQLKKQNLIVRSGDGKISIIDAWIRNVVKTRGVRAVFIDQLGLIKINKIKANQELGDICVKLSLLSKELGIIIVILHQLNRCSDYRDDNRPQITDLRDSGEIEQVADQVWMIYRNCYYHPNKKEDKNKAEILVRKNRFGPTGTVELPVALWCGSWGDNALGFIGKNV